MHGHCALPGGNGQTSFEGCGRFGKGYIHGTKNETIEKETGLSICQEYDLRNTESLEESVRHSDVVYNLVGRMYPTK